MGNYIEDLVITYSGKESGKEFMYRRMCITESLCYTPETNTALLIDYTSIKKKSGHSERAWYTVNLKCLMYMQFKVIN